MKNKIKTMTIILLIVLTAITVVLGYAERENTSELVNIVDDTNKGTAKLDNNLQLDYIARDIATYKNLYCAAQPQALDEFLYYYDVSFQAVGMVDIKGNTATFYKNDNGKLVSCGSITDSTNNVIAGIFTDKVIKDEMNAGKSKNDETFIYRGYGALPYNENGTKFDRYVNINTVTQTASHIYYDIWFEATKSISSKAGFKREYPSFGYQETMLDTLNKARVETAKTYIDKISASKQNYNAQIYFLKCVGDTQSTNIQDLILIKDETVDIPVSKIWDDNNNKDANRIGTIKVKLLANGKDTGKTLKLNESNQWSATFEELEKYNETGNEIIYTVEEEDTTGYIPIITGNQTAGYTITNKQETIDIPVKKVWKDNNNQDGLRPKSITVKLYENGKPTKQTAVLTASDNWNYTFTNLPKYKNKKLVTYTLQEKAVEYYTATEGNKDNNYTITNTHETEKIKLTVKKEWADDNNRDGIRTESITVVLKKDNNVLETIKLDKSNNWSKTIENLDRFENGKEINYIIEEKDIPEGYNFTVTKGDVVNKEVTYTVTNTHEPETTEISVTKVWEDENNQDGIRPKSITVKLYENGNPTDKTAVIKESEDWKYTFTNLQKYKDGKLIEYTVVETDVEYYKSEAGNKDNNYTITNTYKPEKIKLTVKKEWADDNNRDGIRTESITVVLKKDNNVLETMTLDKSNNWSKTIENLDRFENGKEINYIIEEKDIPEGYNFTVTKGEFADKEVTYTATNTHKPEEVEIPVKKQWNDNNNKLGIRPKSIIVKLFADGKDTGKTLELNESNNWNSKFEKLLKYRDGGIEINYTVEEVNVDKYVTTIEGNKTSGFQITNSYYDGYIEITGKVWSDGKGAKANEINGTYGDAWDSGIAGVKVTLKNSNGVPFKATYYHKDENGNLVKDGTDYALTSNNGEYVIRVNYDNSQNVYKLYENQSTIITNLNTAYVDFEYDGIKYTTVANASKEAVNTTSSANKSKAIENKTDRNNVDSKYSTVTSETNITELENAKVRATTQGLVSFETYNDKTTTNRAETLKYCDGNGNCVKANISYPWGDVLTDKCTSCSGEPHSIETYDVEVEIIQNVNLGLFEREDPDIAIFEELKNVNLQLKGNTYKYEYSYKTTEEEKNKDDIYKQAINDGLTEEEALLKAKFQQKGGYQYGLPVDPADIAYGQSTGDFSVMVEYEVNIANLSSTLNMEVDKVLNTFDSRYEVIGVTDKPYGTEGLANLSYTTNGYANIENASEQEYSQIVIGTSDRPLNIELGRFQSKKIYIQYKVNSEALKDLFDEETTILNNAVEIYEYSTKYGANTLYAEQQKGGRTNQPYSGYDVNSHPGNAQLIEENNVLKDKTGEDDTDIAPSFALAYAHTDLSRKISGNVWEDMQTSESANSNERLGNGLKDNGENGIKNVKVELYNVDDGSIAKLYGKKQDGVVGTVDAVVYTDDNGNYSFMSIVDGTIYGLIPGNYYIKYTYGNADNAHITTVNGVEVNGRNYKSTILSKTNNPIIYNLFNGNEFDVYTNEANWNWPLNIGNNVTVAIDNMEDRMKITDLTNATANNPFNITAYSKQFKVGVEFETGNSSLVDQTGDIQGDASFKTNLNVFNFGIIQRPKENINISKTVSHISITLANGQKLIEGNPNDNLSYVKALSNDIKVKNPAGRRIIAEIDSELIQGATLKVNYEITVENNSEIDYDYYQGAVADGIPYDTSKVNKGYYYYGNNSGLALITPTIQYVVDYMDAELVYETGINEDTTWNRVSNVEELKNAGLINQNVYDKLITGKYQILATSAFENLTCEQGKNSKTVQMTVSKLLANQETDYAYENNVEILKVGGKIARANINKDYTPGNYISGSSINEQDDDSIDVIITPPTGITTYIITYLTVGMIGLIVIAISVIFIKKKVLTK